MAAPLNPAATDRGLDVGAPGPLVPASETELRRAPVSASSDLALLAAPRSATAEAYRALAVNLEFSDLEGGLHTVAITSAGVNEGKTAAVANLAVALAEGGRRVIAVDADLRHPSLHTYFGLANGEGLTSAVLNPQAPLALRDTSAPNVRVLTSGPLPPNPAEVLSSSRLDAVMARLVHEADIVLFDTAAAGVLADAAALAARVDGVLLVVGLGRTKRDRARQAKEHLDRVNARFLGVVLTGAPADSKLYQS